jgi:ribonucleoside-triphosphate reductase (formate)
MEFQMAVSHQPVREYFAGMGQAVADRTINRIIVEEGAARRETWSEVAERVTYGNCMLHELGVKDQAAMLRHMRQAALLMSGRHLQHGDDQQFSRNMELFTNCATAATSFLLFYLLLNGSGVGRAYDDAMMLIDWANDMPNVRIVIDPEHPDVKNGLITGFEAPGHYDYWPVRNGTDYEVFMVPDSREGWAKAFERIERHAFAKNHNLLLILDFSLVRAKGSPIKGMQNRPSSGPGPVMIALQNIAQLRGMDVEPWEATMRVDHYCAECVLVGGARRAARMATKTWRDKTIFGFINFKRGGVFWSSNNSVTIDQEFRNACMKVRGLLTVFKDLTVDDLFKLGHIIAIERHAWLVLIALAEASYHDGTGEPGIINQDKLHANDSHLAEYLDGEFAESERFKVDPETAPLMQELAKRVVRAKYTMITNPCGEIALLMLGGYCVIADVVPFHAQSIEDAKEAFEIATRALMRVNLMDSMYKREVARTNRIGVGITGLHEWIYDQFGFTWHDIIDEEKSKSMWLTLAYFKRAIVRTAKEYAAELGVEVPHTNTTFKPAGTTSKLFGLTEGAHLPSMREFMRWVQFRNDDPLVEEYAAKGYPTRKLVQYTGTTIVGFPTRPAICQMDGGDWIVTAAEATPEEQYQFLRLLEKYWIVGVDEDEKPLKNTGNQVSYTLKFDPEIVSFEHFLDTLIDGQFSIRCCSIMPQADTSAYEYQPEEPITPQNYNFWMSRIELANEDIGLEHVACGIGGCPVSFNENEQSA